MAIVVWAPVAVNTVRLGVLLTRAAYYARTIVRTGLNWSSMFYRSAPTQEAVAYIKDRG